MDKIYAGLNRYFNEICKFLEREDSLLLEHIKAICMLNDTFLDTINKYNLGDNKQEKNTMSFEDVYMLAREIIEAIDPAYLEDYDKLFTTGELDFSYEASYEDSHCRTTYHGKVAKRQLININRDFTFDDVRKLVHEFIHYTNGKRYSKNRHYLTEFMSIYFELFAIDYLLDKGANKNELDCFFRIKNESVRAGQFSYYEIPLLAYAKFGSLDKYTVPMLQKFVLGIKKDDFDQECTTAYEKLREIEENKKSAIEDDPDMLGQILAQEFIAQDYRYILGTILAIYAHEHSEFDDIVWLNNHLSEFDEERLSDILFFVGIDIESENFLEDVKDSIDSYVAKMKEKCKETPEI